MMRVFIVFIFILIYSPFHEPVLHKDEGHWLNGQPKTEDKESFQVGNRWFKPNYHAHVVFDWMNHETGKSRKLNDEDMATMQTLASDILLMERGQAKAVTGKEHLESVVGLHQCRQRSASLSERDYQFGQCKLTGHYRLYGGRG